MKRLVLHLNKTLRYFYWILEFIAMCVLFYQILGLCSSLHLEATWDLSLT